MVADVLRQHAEMAAFLWAQRDTLARGDPVDANAIAGLDRRLEAHLDGLRIAGDAAWPFVMEQYEDFPEKGELFVASFLAIEFWDLVQIDRVLQFGRTAPDAAGLAGALAWLPTQKIGPLVRDWINSPDAFKRWLAVSACASHRVDPKDRLPRLMRDEDDRVRAKAYELVGALGREELTGELRHGLDDRNDDAKAQAAAALLLFGSDPDALLALKKLVVGDDPRSIAAMRSVISAGATNDIRSWLSGLLKQPDMVPLAVRGAGMLGDKSVLHWLIHQMRNPALARAAGIAFLELFPDARSDGELFSAETSVLGNAFGDYFEDDPPFLPVANRIKDWAKARKLLE